MSTRAYGAAEPASCTVVLMRSSSAPRRVLPSLVLAQFLGTSPWFAVNAVMPDLQRDFGWDAASVGTLTSAVQIGFVLSRPGFLARTHRLFAGRHLPSRQ